jgi:cyclic pyranopterin phosphate synthase
VTERFIPIADARSMPVRVPAHAPITSALAGPLHDTRQRPLHDLRISVTDRCNFRCRYCMPKEVFDSNYSYLPHSSLLSFEEITRLAAQFVGLGVRKIRLTGGEPLLRKNIESLIEMLAGLRTPDGQPLDLTLTTNGSILQRKAASLKAAGLKRITVSLDALDDSIFRRMNDVDFPVADVLKGIDAAKTAGFESIKLNMVVKRGTNDHEILPMARHFRGTGMALRFIEYMDVGATNGWRMDEVLPSAKVLQRIQREFKLVPLSATSAGETAQRWGYAGPDGQHDSQLGEIGLISSVTHAFCGDCNRARISTEGQLFLCLFASQGHDLRQLLRSSASDQDIRHAISAIWQGRSDRYSELRAQLAEQPGNPQGRKRVEMSYIGG